MDIYKAGDSFRIGYVEGSDIYASGGGFRIGYVKGGDIYASGDSFKIGYVNGDDIYASGGGFKIGYMNGDDIYSSGGGFKIGYVKGGGTNAQKGAAGLLLLGYFNQKSGGNQPPSNPSGGSDEKPSGCLGWFFAFFGFIFLKLPLAGKICALIGAVLPIAGAINEGNGNYILVVPFGFLIGGGIGAIGNFVIPKLSKAGKLGTLIGAVVLGVAFEILLFTGSVSSDFGNIIGFAIFGVIIGAVAGAIIGAIAGLIIKKVGKKKE